MAPSPAASTPAGSDGTPASHCYRLYPAADATPGEGSPGPSRGRSRSADLDDSPEPPAASGAGAAPEAGGEAAGAEPAGGIVGAFRAADLDAVGALGRCFGELLDVCWVEVGAVLDAITPPARGPVRYGAPSRLGSVMLGTADGREERAGSFLMQVLMHREVREQLLAWLAELERSATERGSSAHADG